jgi:ketosteroid isomerase-like protein
VTASSNLDLVRSIYADWARGDFSKADWADPNVEWVSPERLELGRSTGLDGIAAAFREWATTWEDFRIEADEFIEVDADRVLVLVHCAGRGKMSGVDVGQLPGSTAVFYLRGGKVLRYITYWDRDRAFADVGLKK